ncbi:ComEC family competence protein [Phyllobacterium salinisoli]|uniref:ComEC family competence protein n=1 Tax=Phyllobacterium salinisoli TaxID=1899321 RepID=A0A368K779_9HYPH|nr:ComEC/Rec2 family competence protein [Phyllobacterium salinisoli]RCS24333.1 ComEC family competence protein [Phyllobacterium salinisoli]
MRGVHDTGEVDERALLRPGFAVPPVEALPQRMPVPHPPEHRGSTLPTRDLIVARFRSLGRSFAVLLAEEQEHGTHFLFLPVFAAIGAISYFSLAQEPRWMPLISGMSVLVTVRILARQRQIAAMALTFAIAALAGMLTAKTETMLRATPMLGGDITTRVTGRIVAMEQNAGNGWRVTLDVLSTARPTLRHAPDRIRLSARDLPASADIGSGLSGLARLRAQSGPVRPGNYDFAFHGYFNGIGANGFFLGTPKAIDVPQPDGAGARMLLWIAALRQGITESIASSLAGEEGAIAAALITGQREGISEATNEALRMSGLAHILSISGLHMALAGGIVMLVLRALIALFPGFAMRHPVKKYAAGAALLASAFYLLLSGSGVAAQRSFIMLAVMLIAILMDRSAITMRNLALAALIAIILVPHEIVGPSFQMSFSATAALIAAFAWWTERKRNRAKEAPISSFGANGFVGKIVMSVGATAATSVIAGTASGIFALYHFNNTAPLGLLGNVLALPVISVCVMPFAVLSLLMMPFDLEWLPLQVMGSGIEMVKWVAREVASISPDANPGIMPISTLLLWSCGLVLAMFLRTRLRAVSLAFIAAGLVFFIRERGPDLIISDDGRLVAMRTEEGALAVNRKQPSRFTIENWRKAYNATDIIKPQAGSVIAGGFTCEKSVCLAEMRNGQMLAYTDVPDGRKTACAIGDMVILAFAGKNLSCGWKDRHEGKIVITLRDLAIKGSLEIRLGEIGQVASTEPVSMKHVWREPIPPDNASPIKTKTAFSYDANEPFGEPFEPLYVSVETENASRDAENHQSASTDMQSGQSGQPAILTYAIGPPQRPWNQYRLFSRAARGLPEKTSASRTFKAKQKPPGKFTGKPAIIPSANQ